MDIVKFKKPLIIAHRGYKAKYPENTLSAFNAAIDNNALMIELDVTLTKDRKLAVIHDNSIERTTNGKGLVKDYTLQELKEFDAGSWFSPEFKNEKIPTLYEILEQFSQKTMINIEIKEEAYEKHNPFDSVENQIVELLKEFDCFQSTIISSFKDKIIESIGKMPAKPFTAYLSEKPADLSIVNFIKKNKAFSWNADYRILSKDQISMMHKKGIKVFSYTVNDISTAKKLFEIGVDGIFTDNIKLFENLTANKQFAGRQD